MAALSNPAVLLDAACCLLSAAETVLTEHNATLPAGAQLLLPAARYVSAKGGDWLAGLGCDTTLGCSQLVVTPAALIEPDLATLDGPPGWKAAYDLEWAMPVNEAVDCTAPARGDCSLPWTDQPSTVLHESAVILIARYALHMRTATEWKCCLDAAGIGVRSVRVLQSEAFTEGGCSGTRLRLEAAL